MAGNGYPGNIRKLDAGPQPFTVVVEGNISSGKTTFLNHFQRYHDKICIIPEPVEKWRNLNGFNLLELLKKEPLRWAMPFQTYTTLTMLQSHTLQTEKPVKLMERSIFSTRYCFVPCMVRNNAIDPVMYHILQEWYKFIDQSTHIQVDLIVYLRTSPKVIYERVQRRLPLKYLEAVHISHEEWLITNAGLNKNVFVINGDLDLANIVCEYQRFENFCIRSQINIQQP